MVSGRLVGIMVLVVLAGCTPRSPAHKSEPDLSSIRAVAWTNTAQELAGFAATSNATEASIYGFGDSILGGATSVVSGDVVMSGVWTRRAVIMAGQSAKTGKILWRRTLPFGTDGFAECNDDDDGPVFACKVSVGPKQVSTLWVISDRTGAVRSKIPVDSATAYGVSGDELYLATFKAARKETRLDVTVTRRSLTEKRTKWTRNTSFAIKGWGHDGSNGVDIGRDRVAAFSASWQVVVDRETGRLLERSDGARWEEELANGGRVVLDWGDEGAELVDVTLFSRAGRPVADLREGYPDIQEVEPGRVVLGRHLVSVETGATVFTAPKGHKIVAVADRGRAAVVEPIEFEFAENRVPLAAFSTVTGKRLGSWELTGNWSGQTVAAGNGVVTLVQHYDEKTDKTRPPSLHVIDVRKPDEVAVISFGKKLGNYHDSSTLARTPYGVVATGPGAIRGFVAR